MSDQLLLIVGAERFTAWVLLFLVGYLTWQMSRRVREHEFFIPIRGMSIEAYSWSAHQFCWWVYHVADKMAEVDTQYGLYLWGAGIAYLGAFVGAVMVMYPIVHAKFGPRWWWFSTMFVVVVWSIGYGIGLLWIK